MERPAQLQLATLADAPPAGDGWLHEVKLDGYRILAVRESPRAPVRLLTRNFNDWSAQFASLADALATLPGAFMLDGEAAAVLPDGRTSFQALQNARGAGARLAYFAFDALAIGGDDLTTRPLEERKVRLEQLLAGCDPAIKYSEHVVGRGDEVFARACQLGLEGIVSKRRDQPYRPGRGKDWLKVKCTRRQELVIGGFTDPEGSRSGFGALLVGYYQMNQSAQPDQAHSFNQFCYAGKVGTGYSSKVLDELRRELDTLARPTCPFEPALRLKGAHWVEPRLVCEVEFTEWTEDGKLRHPSFQGLRRDKAASEVVREATGPAAGSDSRTAPDASTDTASAGRSRRRAKPSAKRTAPSRAPRGSRAAGSRRAPR